MPPAAPDDEQREAILETATRLVEAGGPSAVKVRAISAKTGFSTGTVYNKGGKVHEIIFEVNRRTLVLVEREISASLAQSEGKSGTQRLSDAVMAYLAFAEARTNLWRATFEYRPPKDRAEPQALSDALARLFEHVEMLFQSEVADPPMRRSLARAVLSAAHAIIFLSIQGKLGRYDGDETRRQVRFIIMACSAAIWTGKPKARKPRAGT